MVGNGFENVVNDDKDLFEGIMETKSDNKKNELEVLKELFNKKEIEVKTELNMAQIIVANKKRMLAQMLDFDELHDVIDDFMVLSVSNKRMGRKEFIEGFKGRQDREENINKNTPDGFRLFGK